MGQVRILTRSVAQSSVNPSAHTAVQLANQLVTHTPSLVWNVHMNSYFESCQHVAHTRCLGCVHLDQVHTSWCQPDQGSLASASRHVGVEHHVSNQLVGPRVRCYTLAGSRGICVTHQEHHHHACTHQHLHKTSSIAVFHSYRSARTDTVTARLHHCHRQHSIVVFNAHIAHLNPNSMRVYYNLHNSSLKLPNK